MKLVVISQTFTRVKDQEIIWPLYGHLTEGMKTSTGPAKKVSNRYSPFKFIQAGV